jgi:hypothetical protein
MYMNLQLNLAQSPSFLFGNPKHLTKVFWLADYFLEILKIHRQVWIFPQEYWLFCI